MSGKGVALSQLQNKQEQESDRESAGLGRGEMPGGRRGALLWRGVETHQEFPPTSTCSYFMLSRYLVLSRGCPKW